MYSSLGYSKNYLKIHIKVTFKGSFPEPEFKLKGHVIAGLQILHQTIGKQITLKFPETILLAGNNRISYKTI